MKRRKAKSRAEKERYKHLNAEFQRIARRDMKAFLSDQGKEIEENNRTGKTKDLFKKFRDTKGTCGPVVKNPPFNTEDVSSISDQGTEIPDA